MSLPVEIDWALIKAGDGEESEAFTIICGIQDVQINGGVNTTDRFVRDCAAPGAVPYRKTKVNGRQLDITGSGLSNTQEEERLNSLLGALNNYTVELYRDDGSDGGVLLGTYSGQFRMTSKNIGAPREGDASLEIALASHGAWDYEDAAGS
jgi:hypothetical protein